MQHAPLDLSFANKTVVVTGGVSGIGFAVAKYFATRSARVFVLDVQGRFVDDVDSDFLDRVSLIHTDMREPAAITHAFKSISEHCTSIEVLVNTESELTQSAPALL